MFTARPMIGSRFFVTTIFISLAIVSAGSVHAQIPLDDPGNEIEVIPALGGGPGFDNFWSLLHASVETIVAEHISPPARQQMYLEAGRALFSGSGRLAPRELVDTFSKLSTDEEFRSELFLLWNTNADPANSKALIELSTGAMLAAVKGSPRFVPEKESRVNRQLSENQYVGIGVVVAVHEGLPMISEPFIGGAAHSAGAVAGDVIVEVDGVECRGKEFSEIIDMLRGEEGSDVQVGLVHSTGGEKRTLKMTRAVIPIPSIESVTRNEDGSWQTLLPDTKIAYLKFVNLVGSTAAELTELIQVAREEGAESLVLDFSPLRQVNRPGAGRVIDLHFANLVADVLMDSVDLGTLHERDAAIPLATGPGTAIEDMPTVVICGGEFPGALFPMLKALSAVGKVQTVGTPVFTNGLCFQEAKVEGERMVIDHLAFALYQPAAVAEPVVMEDVEFVFELPSGTISSFRCDHIPEGENPVGQAIRLLKR